MAGLKNKLKQLTSQKSEIIDQKGDKIALKNKGFYHNF